MDGLQRRFIHDMKDKIKQSHQELEGLDDRIYDLVKDADAGIITIDILSDLLLIHEKFSKHIKYSLEIYRRLGETINAYKETIEQTVV